MPAEFLAELPQLALNIPQLLPVRGGSPDDRLLQPKAPPGGSHGQEAEQRESDQPKLPGDVRGLIVRHLAPP